MIQETGQGWYTVPAVYQMPAQEAAQLSSLVFRDKTDKEDSSTNTTFQCTTKITFVYDSSAIKGQVDEYETDSDDEENV